MSRALNKRELEQVKGDVEYINRKAGYKLAEIRDNRPAILDRSGNFLYHVSMVQLGDFIRLGAAAL